MLDAKERKTMEPSYEESIQKYSLFELEDVLNNIDKEKYPDRYNYVLERYKELKKDDGINNKQTLDKDYASGNKRFLNLLIDVISQFVFIFIYSVILGILGMGRIALFWKGYPLAFFLEFIYFVLFEYYKQQTIGKMITKTWIIAENGEKPSLRQIIIRTLCRFIPFEALSFLGNPPIGWHDTISKTRVVNIDFKNKKY